VEVGDLRRRPCRSRVVELGAAWVPTAGSGLEGRLVWGPLCGHNRVEPEGVGVGHDAGWSAAQDHLVRLSSNAAHRIVGGATHNALVAYRGYAAVTAQGSLDVVTSIRTAQPLGG
jgi:hypothetical protein